MISFIKGEIAYVFHNYIILENNNIGYQIFLSQNGIGKIAEKKEQVKIFTYMAVKEDEIALYGFLEKEELDIFNMLISVSGIGPKGALNIISDLSPREIMLAIISEDINTLSKAQGVGKKTAQRLVLELKDKIKTSDAMEGINPQQAINLKTQSEPKAEAIEALMSLGYSKSEAVKVVFEISNDITKTEQIIKLALKKLATF